MRAAVVALVLALLAAPVAAPSSTGTDAAGPTAARAATSVGSVGADDVTVDELPLVDAATQGPAEGVVDPATASAVSVDDLAGDRTVSDVVLTDDVQTIGVTWADESVAPDVEVRTRTDGVWSGWTAMSVSETEIDADSVDARHEAKAGTDAYWIGDAQAIQLSVPTGTAALPQDASLSLVGSPQTVSTSARTTAASYLASSSGPTVIPRSVWGARAPSCTPDVATGLVGAVVHHTAGSNSYSTLAQAMQQIRNDQAYHMDSRGWCDLGYNFVVDKWGNIYEGRAGSLTQPVIGVHASGYNTGTVGVSMLGNFVDVVPSNEMISSVATIIGYRLGAYGVSPLGTSTYPSTGATMPSIIAHRDVAATACPGDQGYAKMDRIRSLAAVVAGEHANAAPRGFWDATDVSGSTITAIGWALDPDATEPITVRAYLDGLLATEVVADGSRPDIGAAFGLGDEHGFSVGIPAAGGTHQVCLGLLDLPVGSEVRLGCQDVTVETSSTVVNPTVVDVWRFWSPGFGNAHFYTADAGEAATITASDRNWVPEGLAFHAYALTGGTCDVGTQAVYRFYSARFQSHFFTADQAERDVIRRTDSNWAYEGLAYCVPSAGTAGSSPLYRFWSPRFGKHFYTASAAEAQTIRSGDTNWQYEGEAYSVLP